MALVKFYRGNKAKYSATKYPDGIYFSLDTKEILVNGASYGYQGNTKEIQQVEYTAPNTIKIIYKDGSEHKVVLQTAEAGVNAEASKGGLMTKEMAYKLSTVSEGAEKNIIDTISVDNKLITPVSKRVNIDTIPLKEAIEKNKLIAKNDSVEVVPGIGTGIDIQPTKVGVKIAPNGGLQVTPNGLQVISSEAESYTGDDKAIVVDSVAVGGKKKVSLKLDTTANNILTTSTNGAYASVKLKKLDVPASENEIATRYGLIKVTADGTESTLEGSTIDILKDKFLKNVEIGKIPTGQPDAGKDALIFSFVIADGSTVQRYVQISTLMSGVQAGKGLEIDGSGKLGIKLSNKGKQSAHGGNVASLEVDETGLYIDGLLESIQEYAPEVTSTTQDMIGIEIDENSKPDVTIYKITAKDIAKQSELDVTVQKVRQLKKDTKSGMDALTGLLQDLSSTLEWHEAD